MSHLPLTFTVGNGAKVPFQSNAAVAQINLFGNAPWQIGSVYSTTLSATYTAWTGLQTQTLSAALPFPAFNLPTGSQGYCIISLSVAQVQQSGVLYGLPEIILTTTAGAYRSSTGGTSSFTFKTGRTYSTFTLSIVVPAYSATAQPQQVTSFNLSAILLGLPPS